MGLWDIRKSKGMWLELDIRIFLQKPPKRAAKSPKSPDYIVEDNYSREHPKSAMAMALTHLRPYFGVTRLDEIHLERHHGPPKTVRKILNLNIIFSFL